MTSTPVSPDALSADVLVIFGITGDLARVMTFRSLYRLEARGLLQCPVVGVAVDDWTVDRLVQRARASIEGAGEQLDPAVFDRLAARLSYVGRDFKHAANDPAGGQAVVRERRLQRRRDVRAGRRRRQGHGLPRLLPRDPSVPLRHGLPGP